MLLYYNMFNLINLFLILFSSLKLIKTIKVSSYNKNIIMISVTLNIIQLITAFHINHNIVSIPYNQFNCVMLFTQISLSTLFLIFMQKIYTLKKITRHISANNEQQSTLLETTLAKIGAILHSQLNLSDTLNTIADMVADMLHANQSIITLRDSNDNQLTIAATYGINIPPFTLPMDSSLSQKVINEYKTIYINDTIDCPELFTPKLLFSKIRSIIATPLIQSGNIIGTIEVYSQKVNAFDDNDAAFLTVIAHHAGAAITAAKLYEETKQKLLDEKHLSAIAYSTALTIDANAMMDECTHHVLSALHADIAIGCLSSDLEYNFSVVSNVNINNKLSCIDLNLFPPLNAFIDKLQPFNSFHDSLPSLASLFPSAANINYFLILPIVVNKRLLGLIFLGWHGLTPSNNTKQHAFMKLMAKQIAIGLEKAHFYHQIKSMALSDGLTKLANRRNFDMFLKTELRRAESLNKHLSLIMLDLDKFKQYNDTFGHLNGDQLLQQIGIILKNNVRSIDLPARYGGEEFSIILPEGNISEAICCAEHLRKIIEGYTFTDQDGNCTAPMTASFGIATYDPNITNNAPSTTTMIAIADKALYQAKQEGRNRVISANIFQ